MKTAMQFAKQELSAGRHPMIGVCFDGISHYLTDNAGSLLKDRSFPAADAAYTARSKIIDRALRTL